MYRAFFDQMPYQGLALFSMLLFIGLFFGVLLRFFVFRRREELSALAALPLEDGEQGSVGQEAR